MIRRAREVQIFNVSFLDLLSCALGGVLLLLLITMSTAQQQANSYKSQLEEFKKTRIKLTDELGQSQQAVVELIEKQKALFTKLKALLEKQAGLIEAKKSSDEAIKKLNDLKIRLEKAQATLIGLRGDLRSTAFLFDTSESMKYTNRFDEYKELLKSWVDKLPHEKFNVIQFFGAPKHVKTWRPNEMVKSSDDNRAAAGKFIDTFEPWGKTPSRTALKIAFDLPEVTCIILFSDGAPSDVEDYKLILKEVQQWQQTRRQRITINTIGLGDYFENEHGDFLQKLAAQNGGVFIGR